MSELGHLQGDLYFRLSKITLAWAQDLATRSICLSGLLGFVCWVWPSATVLQLTDWFDDTVSIVS